MKCGVAVTAPAEGAAVRGAVVVGPTLVVVVVVDAAAHPWLVMVLVSRVTAPFWASNRPLMVAPVVAVMDSDARTVPIRCEPVPSVAELPTCQNTLQAWPPPSTMTALFDAVMRVDAVWKMNTALGSPWVSSVKVPVIPRVGEL